VAHAPGVFTATGSGSGWAIFQNYVSAANQPLNYGTIAAAPGQVGTLWLTGTGAISGVDGNTPPVGNLPYTVEIFIGGVPVTNTLYAGRAPAFSGLDQYVFQIPSGAPTGCFVPLYVRVNGAVSNSTTLAIMPQVRACSDAHNPIASALGEGRQNRRRVAVPGDHQRRPICRHRSYSLRRQSRGTRHAGTGRPVRL
jgi:hypothetical protein